MTFASTSPQQSSVDFAGYALLKLNAHGPHFAALFNRRIASFVGVPDSKGWDVSGKLSISDGPFWGKLETVFRDNELRMLEDAFRDIGLNDPGPCRYLGGDQRLECQRQVESWAFPTGR